MGWMPFRLASNDAVRDGVALLNGETMSDVCILATDLAKRSFLGPWHRWGWGGSTPSRAKLM